MKFRHKSIAGDTRLLPNLWGGTMKSFAKILLALVISITAFAFAQDTYANDPIRTFVSYRAGFGTFGYEMGKFDQASFTFTVDPADASKNTVTFSVESGTINSGNDKRNSDMTGPDMLDTVQFPTIDFTSTSVKDTGDGNLEVTGDITIHGVTKSITVNAQKVGEGDDFQGKHRIGYFLTFSFNRQDYGMAGFAGAVGDVIDITIAANGVKQ
jgi:polyisoprenoid-binding protein YceI